MSIQRYILWIHDSSDCAWFWNFEYPTNVQKFGIDVGF